MSTRYHQKYNNNYNNSNEKSIVGESHFDTKWNNHWHWNNFSMIIICDFFSLRSAKLDTFEWNFLFNSLQPLMWQIVKLFGSRKRRWNNFFFLVDLIEVYPFIVLSQTPGKNPHRFKNWHSSVSKLHKTQKFSINLFPRRFCYNVP